jgi:hypothetical protein
VKGAHRYAEEGTYTVTVTMTDTDQTAQPAPVTSTADIPDASLGASVSSGGAYTPIIHVVLPPTTPPGTAAQRAFAANATSTQPGYVWCGRSSSSLLMRRKEPGSCRAP